MEISAGAIMWARDEYTQQVAKIKDNIEYNIEQKRKLKRELAFLNANLIMCKDELEKFIINEAGWTTYYAEQYMKNDGPIDEEAPPLPPTAPLPPADDVAPTAPLPPAAPPAIEAAPAAPPAIEAAPAAPPAIEAAPAAPPAIEAAPAPPPAIEAAPAAPSAIEAALTAPPAIEALAVLSAPKSPSKHISPRKPSIDISFYDESLTTDDSEWHSIAPKKIKEQKKDGFKEPDDQWKCNFGYNAKGKLLCANVSCKRNHYDCKELLCPYTYKLKTGCKQFKQIDETTGVHCCPYYHE
jgi:hypothetical protein